MNRKNYPRSLLTLGLFSTLAGISTGVFAAGSYTPLMNVADLGNAYSGGAAIAQDASTNYYNSAGLVRIPHQQLVVSATGVLAHVKYTGSASAPGLGLPYNDSGSASTYSPALIPAIHYALPLSDALYFGMSVTEPYGVSYSYPDDSLVRYDIVSAKAQSLDLSPSLAYKVSDQFSVGVGIDALYMSVYQKYMVRTQPFTVNSDSIAKADLSGWGYGWHAGMLYQITPHTRVGLNYRSQIVNQLAGKSQLSVYNGPATGTTTSNNFQSRITTPPTTSLSLYHDMTNRWAIMGTVDYTQWSVYKTVPVNNAASLGSQTVSISIPQYYHNAWRYAVGTSYQLTPRWLIRSGISYEQGASNATYRDMLIPEGTHTDIAVGGHYQASTTVGLDIGYVHNFFKAVPMNYVSDYSHNSLNGSYRPAVDNLGLQLTWNIT